MISSDSGGGSGVLKGINDKDSWLENEHKQLSIKVLMMGLPVLTLFIHTGYKETHKEKLDGTQTDGVIAVFVVLLLCGRRVGMGIKDLSKMVKRVTGSDWSVLQ